MTTPEPGRFTSDWAIPRQWAALDSWPVAGDKTYVTACTIMERRLLEIQGDDTVPH